MIEPMDPASVKVTIYHVCPHGATGSALGPHAVVSYWWADPNRVRVVLAGDYTPDDAQAVHDAVLAAVTLAPGDAIRAAQDLAAESLS